MRVVLDVTEYTVVASCAEDHRGRHGSEEQARAPKPSARGQGKRGVLCVCAPRQRTHTQAPGPPPPLTRSERHTQ